MEKKKAPHPHSNPNEDLNELDELDELDRAYTSITGYKPKRLRKKAKRSSKLLPLIIVLTLILCVGAFCAFSLRYGTLFDGILTMPDVTMGGIPMGGMSKADAKAQLSQFAAQAYSQKMTIRVLDSTLELSPAFTGASLDTETAVDDAYNNGSTGEFDLIPYLNLNLGAVRSAVDSLGKQYNSDFVQTEVQFDGEIPSLEPGAPTQQGMMLTITLGKPQYGLDTENLYQQVLAAYNSGTMTVEGSCSQLEPNRPDLDALYAQSYVAPVDATMDPETFQVTPESYGYHFDLEGAKASLAQSGYGQCLQFAFVKIPPKVTAESLSSKLFCDVLGSAQTPYQGSDTNNRNTNLALACEAINGLVLLPGETFSYNDTLGERTADKGYKEAPSYVGGLTIDTLGGGICQVSSTLYYSTLFADLEILERHNHGYVSDYIDKGMDATVTWDGADLRFANNTNYPIRIEAWRAEGYVNVRILGTDEKDYYIKMTYKVLETTPYDTVYEEMPADNKEGHKDGDVIVTPYRGYIVRAYKEKYSKATDELISREQESYNIYNKRDKVICRIVENTPDPAPDSTEPVE